MAEEIAVPVETAPATARLTGAAAALAALMAALWGTNPTALKLALRGLPPMGSAGLRFSIAAFGVWVVCRAMGVQAWPKRGEWPWLATTGALFVVQIATFTLGVYWGTASHSIVLLHSYPFFVVALAHFFIPGERTSWGRLAGLVAAFAGIVALFAGEWGAWEGTQLLGDSVQLISAFLLGAQVVFLKHAVARIDSTRLVLWQMVIGAAVFLLYSLAVEDLAGCRPGAVSMLAILYQGVIIGTFCFTVWTWLLRHHAASRLAIFGFVAPVVGVAISALALGETITPGLLVSASLVAAGIVLANLR